MWLRGRAAVRPGTRTSRSGTAAGRFLWRAPYICASFPAFDKSVDKGGSPLSGRGATKLAKGLAVLAAIMLAGPVLAAIPADPAGSGAIVGAVNWLQGTLLGTVATVVAVIAVAAVGFMMLTGRINWRHGAVVILGCFILFGAASIVGGIRAAAVGG